MKVQGCGVENPLFDEHFQNTVEQIVSSAYVHIWGRDRAKKLLQCLRNVSRSHVALLACDSAVNSIISSEMLWRHFFSLSCKSNCGSAFFWGTLSTSLSFFRFQGSSLFSLSKFVGRCQLAG